MTSSLSANEELTVDLFRSALNATHAESPGPTLYSNIYDPVDLKIHLFHFHDSENGIVLEVEGELNKGEWVEDLPMRFTPNNAAMAFSAAAPPEQVPPSVPLDWSPSRLIGMYGTDEYQIEIKQERDQLWVYPSIGLRAPLRYIGDECFITFRVGTRNDYQFVYNREGDVVSLILNRNGRSTVLRRQ